MMRFGKQIISIIITLFSFYTFIWGGDLNKNKIAESAQEICTLLVGNEIPRLKLNTIDGELFDINDAVSKKPTIIIFYRGGWCPFCNLHLAELKDIEDDLLKLGYQIIAISMDKPEKLRESLAKHEMKYTLLSDSEGIAAKAFGLAFKAEDGYVKKLKIINMDIEKASGQDHHILPVPAVFLIGTDQIIKFEYINPNYKVRLKNRTLLEVAKAELIKEPH